MVKYTQQQNMKFIADTCKELGFSDVCFMVAKAKVESTLNNMAKNGKYVGLFQLGDGVGGIKGDDRLNPKSCTKGAIKYLLYNKEQVAKQLPSLKWENYYGYICHQQGLGGFKYLVQNQSKTLAQLQKDAPKRYKAIKSNTPKGSNPVTVGDFLTIWKNKFQANMDSCNRELACIGVDVEGLSDDSTEGIFGLEQLEKAMKEKGTSITEVYPKVNNACAVSFDLLPTKSNSQVETAYDYMLYGGIAIALFSGFFIFKK